MKITVYQPKVSRVGGSIKTILAFADTFKELGHEVKISTNINNPKLGGFAKVIQFYDLKNINICDFSYDIHQDSDFIFTHSGKARPESNFKTNLPVIYWCVRYKPEIKYLDLWTNSKTTNEKLGGDLKVIYPPHIYSLFHKYSNQEKIFDICSIIRLDGRKNKKGHGELFEIANKLQDKKIAVIIGNNHNDSFPMPTNNIKFFQNLNKEQLAEILGRSKSFLLTSDKESASLSIYEALNSGCWVFGKDVGAIKEQIGPCGYIYGNIDILINRIKDFLYKYDNVVGYRNNMVNQCMLQGWQFDKEFQIEKIKKLLKEIEQKL